MPPCHPQNKGYRFFPTHSALPQLALPASWNSWPCFRELMAHFGCSARSLLELPVSWCLSQPTLALRLSSFLRLSHPSSFLPPDLRSFIFYQGLAKTSAPESQVSLLLSGLRYICCNLYGIRLRCLLVTQLSPL